MDTSEFEEPKPRDLSGIFLWLLTDMILSATIRLIVAAASG